MSQFLSSLTLDLNRTVTENGAVTNKSSLDPALDFFALAGAMRERTADAADLFQMAYVDDPLIALRTMFYLRDVRGGQGERDVFRACLSRLSEIDPQTYIHVLKLVPLYGRWDDVLHNGVTPEALNVIEDQWNADVAALQNGEPVSLMAKWLPSVKTSSAATRKLAAELASGLWLHPVQYRKTLSKLRAKIKLLEQQMSANDWDSINYGKLPSQAHRRHVKAFQRHTFDRYQRYLDSVNRGEQKINVKTVYPHEIWQMVHGGKGGLAYAEVAWDALPDYTNGTNALVMADTSASMTWHNNARAMAVAVSLALYFAERNTGPFHGYFMTFNSQPELKQVRGNSLTERLFSIRGPVGGSTNLSAAFDAILRAGMGDPEGMPKVLYIISDMEFDQAVQRGRSVFEDAKQRFAAHGLTLPHVVFWNVEARQNQAPALAHDGNVTLVSGLSPTTFSQVVEGKTPRELMESVVNGERYQRVTLP